MNAQTPTPEQAAEALALATSSSAALTKRVIAVRVAMGGFALASLAALLILGFVDGVGGTIGSTAMIMGGLIALLIVAVPAQGRFREKNFTWRYVTAILSWGAIYVGVIALGTTVFRDAPVFWIIGAVLSAVPGLAFALLAPKATR